MREAPFVKNGIWSRFGIVGAFAWVVAAFGWTIDANAAEVVQLTQTSCQFLEPEGKDHDFKSAKAEDCEKINAANGATRVARSQALTLKAGEYVFRVTNQNVPYELGFWLREKDYDWKNPIHKVTKLSVSGGGLATGASREYKIILKPGEYVYSCPLNPTPDYRLVVTPG